MAIKVSTQTAIDDSRNFFPDNISGVYNNLHPSSNINATSTISFSNPAQSITMSSNTTYSTANRGAGKQLTITLDRSTSGYTPTFGSEVEFAGGTPTWSNRRHWIISMTCWNSSTVRATALGFDEPGTVSSSMDSTFSLSNWSTTVYDFGTSFEQAWCYVRFNHDTSNNRVKVEYSSGNTTAVATVYTEYIDYTGMTGTISAEAQYNGSFSSSGTTNQATWGPRPQDDGYNSGTYYSVPTGSGVRQFGWMAANNPNFGTGGNSGVTGSFSVPAFRVKLTSNEGTFYATGAWSQSLTLSATYGNSPGL